MNQTTGFSLIPATKTVSVPKQMNQTTNLYKGKQIEKTLNKLKKKHKVGRERYALPH